jgi:hypothetical protein
MDLRKEIRTALLVFLLLTACSCRSCCAVLVPHLEQPYSNPSATLGESELVGIWEARYMEWGFDELILKPDGTFKQVYRELTRENYTYETPWNEWWVERFSDGRVRVHLEGARYYLAGIKVAEGVQSIPYFYDPVGEKQLHMIDELVLNVRSTSSGEIILLHMWTDFDRGFAIIGGRAEEFHRVETPSPLPSPSNRSD